MDEVAGLFSQLAGVETTTSPRASALAATNLTMSLIAAIICIPYTPIWYKEGEVNTNDSSYPAAAEALKSQVESMGKSLNTSYIRLFITAG